MVEEEEEQRKETLKGRVEGKKEEMHAWSCL